jgi:hypothetical protein
MDLKGFDVKWLKGIMFATSEAKKVKKDGRETIRHIPVERQATADDVLNWRVDGDQVVIVTKDGRKYRVDKGESGDGGPSGAPTIDQIKDEILKIKPDFDFKGLKVKAEYVQALEDLTKEQAKE